VGEDDRFGRGNPRGVPSDLPAELAVPIGNLRANPPRIQKDGWEEVGLKVRHFLPLGELSQSAGWICGELGGPAREGLESL